MARAMIMTGMLLLLTEIAQARAINPGSFQDIMTDNGKLFVVIAVILTIFIGLCLYLLRIDKKINKLENEE